MVFPVFAEVDKKGHCFPKTLNQPSPRLGFSSDLCTALRIHANTAVLCSGFLSAVLQMVRLFLFRLGSLLGLFALLVWEAFYRPNGDSFTGKHNRKTKIILESYVFIYHSGSPEQFDQLICTFFAGNNFKRQNAYSFSENIWKVCFSVCHNLSNENSSFIFALRSYLVNVATHL